MIRANGSAIAIFLLWTSRAGRTRIAAQIYARKANVRRPAARKEPSATPSFQIAQLATAAAYGAISDIVIANELCVLMELFINPYFFDNICYVISIT